MTRTRLSALVLSTLLLLAASTSAAPTAKTFVQAKHGQLTALVQQKGAASDKKLQALFDEIIDYESLARQSLDKHWVPRTDAERAEFTAVLQKLVRRAYRKNLDKTAGYEISYEGDSAVGKGRLVKTVAHSKTDARQDPISIDYVVVQDGSVWRITDIVTEGSSLMNNYRRQFHRIIDKKGFPELLRRMKKKLESG